MTSDTRQTCGDLHKSAIDQIVSLYESDQYGFDDSLRAAFVAGQADKVYIGACDAAMFRVSDDRRDFLFGVLKWIADLYKLAITSLEYEFAINGNPGKSFEFWLCRSPEAVEIVKRLKEVEPNCEAWHYIRGQLTGIPTDEIDPLYHLRSTFNDRCD